MPYIYKLAASLLCLSALTFVDSTSAAAFKRVKEGDAAPVFTLPALDGGSVSLEEYKDNTLTIISFWGTWNPRSKDLLIDEQKLLDEFGEKGLKILTVNAEGANPPANLEEILQNFLSENNLTLRVAVDRELDQYNAWGVIATPATAFLDKDLKVVYEFAGRPTSAFADMREKIMQIFGIVEDTPLARKPKRARFKAPKSIQLRYGLAKVLFDRGQMKKGLRKLERDVLKKLPEFPEANALKGAFHLGLYLEGNQAEAANAREAFAKALELDETVPLALAGLAHFSLVDGDLEKAIDLTRKAVSYTEPEALPDLGPDDAASEKVAASEKDAAAEEAKTPGANADETVESKEVAASEKDAAAEEAKTPGANADETVEGKEVAASEKDAAVEEAETSGANTDETVAGKEVATSEEEKTAASIADAATEEESQAPETPATGPEARINEQLTKAEKALKAGSEDEARVLVSQIVEGLLNIKSRPKMKGRGLLIQQQKQEKINEKLESHPEG